MRLYNYIWLVLQALGGLRSVISSPLNSINGASEEELSGCLHDCTIKTGFCENGGSCKKLADHCSPSSYTCVCPPGFVGSRCSEIDEPCKYDKILTDFNCYCQHGAICRKIDSDCIATSFRCQCLDGFEGELCERVSTTDQRVNVTESREPVVPHQHTTNSTLPTTDRPLVSEGSKRSLSTSALTKTGTVRSSTLPASTSTAPSPTPETSFAIIRNTVTSATNWTSTESTAAKPNSEMPDLDAVLDQLKNAKLEEQSGPQVCSGCVHGSCSAIDGELPKCVCDPGYFGQFCDSQCIRDCVNGGVCSISQGLEYCHCPAQFEGEFCERERPVPSEPSEDLTGSSGTPINLQIEATASKYGKRYCSANFVCIHGICNTTDPTRPNCKCDEGYIGAFCHKKCSKKCLNGGSCFLLDDIEFCACPRGYTGKLCEDKIDSATTHKAKSTQETKTKRFRISMKSFAAKMRAISHDRLQKSPVSGRNRKCATNFVCLNGICKVNQDGGPQCHCYEGFVGVFCQHKCTLKCANWGVCMVVQGQQVCSCPPGFRGKYCENLMFHDKGKETSKPSAETRTDPVTEKSTESATAVMGPTVGVGNTTANTASSPGGSVHTTQASQANVTEIPRLEQVANSAENKT